MERTFVAGQNLIEARQNLTFRPDLVHSGTLISFDLTFCLLLQATPSHSTAYYHEYYQH